jgi:hypothetical protein
LTERTGLRAPSRSDPGAAWHLELAVDLRAQYAGTAAPGLGVTVTGGRALGAFLELSSALPRSEALGGGQAQWWRVALGGGVRYRAELSWLWLEPALSVEGAWVQASGQGFVTNTTAGGFDASVCAHLLAGRAVTGPLSIYLGARGCAWPLNNQIAVTAVDQALPMPRYELGGLIGFSLGFPLKGSAQSRPEDT